jgi:hypothetical protein
MRPARLQAGFAAFVNLKGDDIVYISAGGVLPPAIFPFPNFILRNLPQ